MTTYTSGPYGSAGGLSAAPQWLTQYGYGTAPGQTNTGYYEQQTPTGSFAAADWAGPAQQQNAQAFAASNPFIGQTSQGINGQGSVMGYAQQIANQGQQANPYLGQTTQQSQGAGANPYAGQNQYLQSNIAAAQKSVTDNFNATVNPQLASSEAASGSFGNAGLAGQRERAYQGLASQLGNTAQSMLMQDYTQQQQLAEAALNRNQQNNQFNSGLNASDLSRNMAGMFQQNNQAMQGFGQQLGAAQFDASLGNNVNQFNASMGQNDLTRNASLAGQQGMFNAGAQNTNSMFNAGQGNQMGLQNMNSRNQLNMFNTGQGNNFLQWAGNLDAQIDQNNWSRQNQGFQNQLNALNTFGNLGQLGINNATSLNNADLQQWSQIANVINAIGGNGGVNTQNLQGNQWLSALGGLLAGGNMWGSMTGGGK